MTIRPKTLWYHELSCTRDFWPIGHTVGCFLKLPCESLKGKVVLVLGVLRFLSLDVTIASHQILLAKISEDERFNNWK